MALKPNAQLIFERYDVERDGVTLWFLCHDPGPGEVSHYPAYITNAELNSITTLQQFNDLLLTKLKRYYRADGIASKLDSLLGRTLTLP